MYSVMLYNVLCVLLLCFCVCVICFLTLTKCVRAVGVHRVKLYVMFCVLVCDMSDVRVCGWFVILCVLLYSVCLCVFACMCDCGVCVVAYVFV